MAATTRLFGLSITIGVEIRTLTLAFDVAFVEPKPIFGIPVLSPTLSRPTPKGANMHKAMINHWVRNPNTNNIGQVKRVYKDPKTHKQIGVFVKIPGEKTLALWPTEFVRPARPPKAAKPKRHVR